MPERVQIHKGIRPKSDMDDIATEAAWIYKYAFSDEAMVLEENSKAPEKRGGGGPIVNEDEDDWDVPTTAPPPDTSVSDSSSAGKGKGLPREVIPKIQAAIEYLKAGYEIPFIAVYRKEYCYMVDESEETLVIDDNGNSEFSNGARLKQDIKNLHRLWKVYDWDEKWVKFIEKKEALKKIFQEVQKYQLKVASGDSDVVGEKKSDGDTDERKEGDVKGTEEENPSVDDMAKSLAKVEVDPDVRILEDSDFDKIYNANDEDELSDVQSWFGLHFGDVVHTINNRARSHKKPVKKTLYSICRKSGLMPLMRKFGLQPHEFGQNLKENYHRFTPANIEDHPAVCSDPFVARRFPTTDAVLKACRLMYVEELAKDATVRSAARSFFFERALVSTFPTQSGKSFVDEHHEYYELLYLSSKPIKSFQGDLFLKLTQAEQEGFIVITIDYDFIDAEERGKKILQGKKPDRNDNTTVVNHFVELFNLDVFGEVAEAWNDERTLVINELINEHLVPQFNREIRSKLEKECKERVKASCELKLFDKINVKPFNVVEGNEYPEDEDMESCSPVMACKVGGKDAPTFFANLDGEGEVTDFLRLDNFLLRTTSKNIYDVDKKQADINALKHFLSRKQPAAIVIGGENVDSHRVVYEDIQICVRETIHEEGIPDVVVHMVDTEVARIYEISERAMGEFPEYPHALRHAISLARQFQDPLSEYAALCNPDDEIMCLKLNRFQGNVETIELRAALERAFINAVCLAGVDCGRISEHKHCSSTLQFVSGFGPRKAGAFLRAIVHEGSLSSRQDLVTRGLMGQLIFENCSGFLKIRSNSYANDAYVDVLDETRIHPENYDFARKMAADSLEYPQDEEGEYPEQAMTEIFEKPETVEDLGLDDYAAEIEKKQNLKKRNSLYDIKREFFNPFKDYRPLYKPMDRKDLFYLVTGETEKTLREGCILECQISGTSKNGAMTRLDNGLMGFIPREKISDQPVDYVEDRVKKGMMVHCRVDRIDMATYSIDLSTRSSDLNAVSVDVTKLDEYFDSRRAENFKNIIHSSNKPKKKGRAKRVIVHPSFKNVSFREAEKLLETCEVGETIIRPSGRSEDHLTVTWKVSEDLYQHVDVEERDKVNKFSLGQTLMIGDERYEDLDEIIARYIQPMAANIQEMKDYKYYRTGSKEDMDTLLKIEKTKTPARIPYFFSISDEYVGKFVLSYLPGTRPRHEYVTVIPEGFRFRKLKFDTIDRMVGWFKRHYNEKPPRAEPSRQRESSRRTDDKSVRGRVDSNYGRRDGASDYRGGSNYDNGYNRGGYDDRRGYNDSVGTSHGTDGSGGYNDRGGGYDRGESRSVYDRRKGGRAGDYRSRGDSHLGYEGGGYDGRRGDDSNQYNDGGRGYDGNQQRSYGNEDDVWD